MVIVGGLLNSTSSNVCTQTIRTEAISLCLLASLYTLSSVVDMKCVINYDKGNSYMDKNQGIQNTRTLAQYVNAYKYDWNEYTKPT